MNTKLNRLLIPAFMGTALILGAFQSSAYADADMPAGREQAATASRHDRMQARLDKLATRLELKASQQTAWDEFARSVSMLTQHDLKRPGKDADAAAMARYRADRAGEMADKLKGIAAATEKLQAQLDPDQKKVLDRAFRRFTRMEHGWHNEDWKHGRPGRQDEDVSWVGARILLGDTMMMNLIKQHNQEQMLD